MEKPLFEQNGILTIGMVNISYPTLCRLKAFLSVSGASGGEMLLNSPVGADTPV